MTTTTSTDIAVIGWAQTPMVRTTDQSETNLLLHCITDALTPLGLTRADIDFTCLGSCDYITGQAFSFVSNLDAIGAWPPKRRKNSSNGSACWRTATRCLVEILTTAGDRRALRSANEEGAPARGARAAGAFWATWAPAWPVATEKAVPPSSSAAATP